MSLQRGQGKEYLQDSHISSSLALSMLIRKEGLSWRAIWTMGLWEEISFSFGFQKEFVSGNDWWFSKQWFAFWIALSYWHGLINVCHQNVCSWQLLVTLALLVVWEVFLMSESSVNPAQGRDRVRRRECSTEIRTLLEFLLLPSHSGPITNCWSCQEFWACM